MPQTILALLGLMLISQFTLRQQHDIIQDHLEMIRTEVGTMAAAVATERLERITSMAFDSATSGSLVLTSPSALTSRDLFRSDAPSDDVDDFDGVSVIVVRDAARDTLSFDVSSTVSYADELNPNHLVPTQTKFKRVVVTVTSRSVAFADSVKLVRLVSCGSACDW